MLDELANKYQRDNANYQEKVRQLQDEHEEQIKTLSQQIEAEQVHLHISKVLQIKVRHSWLSITFWKDVNLRE